MNAYESPVSYKLIYVFRVPYEDHADLLKIGEATIKTSFSPAQLPPNCELLDKAAHKRIQQETKTAMTQYELLHTELAVRKIELNDGSTMISPFRDYDVNDVLSRSGYPSRKFYDTKRPSEWYPVALQTAKNAIKAVKEGRNTLTEAEKTEAEKTDTNNPAKTDRPAITLRDEQMDAVNTTIAVFKKKDKMLWDCKMRFGKTISACSLAKACDFKKTIVITHRPVVADGWQNDYHLIFGDSDDHIFLTKIKGGQEVDFDERIDANNAHALRNLAKSGKHFMYFASMQDLRESARVKNGGYKKNDAVFDMDWDFVIYDEAHEGTQTDLGQKVQALIEAPKKGKRPKVLSLSGTPYNIIGQYEDYVYSWDYVMEQKRKREWDEKYPGVPNPYADLPELRIYTFDLRDSMPESYRYETEDMAFNFREFFRTWTGNPKEDFRPLPSGARIGGFVHEADVKAFLNLITTDSKESRYPFSTAEQREMFKHTFWIVPGVKAAKALSELLRRHPVFMHYKIANVAGDGDMEKAYDDALKEVRGAIRQNPYTITISCGRLTTGVTVPEWTAVMLLAGSANTAAAGYMQTIFRVQSAGSIDGKQKELCYAFDFAPDRAIKVLSDVHAIGKKGNKGDDSGRAALGEFLNFCPVLSVDGTGMNSYDVPKLMRQIKRMTVDKAIKSGFDDDSVYKSDTGIVMDENDAALFNKLNSILSRQKQAKTPKNVKINKQGLTKEEYGKADKAKNKPKRQRTPEEQALLEKERQQRKEREKVIQLLRNISIRLPLLIYGAAVDLTEHIHMENFITLVDDESWKEFMPKDVTKRLFRQLLKYYDEDVIVGAGLRIRRMARAADELPPTQRVLRIAEIFSLFRNPDKETVLTPWRVVNMHLSDMVGGFCFYDETFQHPDGLLEKPRFVDRGKVTDAVLNNPKAKILELNSKSGLYPLYMVYSIYAKKLTASDDTIPLEEAQQLWRETVEENVYVLCKTEMARQITVRTLAGYQDWNVNAVYLTKLMERMKIMPRLANKLRNPVTWGKEGEKMNFEAVVGNPPYQESGGSGGTNDAPVYQYFAGAAEAVKPHYATLIMPARWFSGGRENLLGEFRKHMLQSGRIAKLYVYPEASDVFPTVEIKAGLCYYLQEDAHSGKCHYRIVENGNALDYERDLAESDFLIRNPVLAAIVEKVKQQDKDAATVDTIISGDTPFGIGTKPEESKKYSIDLYETKEEPHTTILLYYEKGQRKTAYVEKSAITKNAQDIDSVKVFIPKAGGSGNDPLVLGKPEVYPANSVCSQTFVYAPFASAAEANNFVSYLKTKFFRALVSAVKISQDALSSVYRLVPMQDYSHPWSDRMLYKKYRLTEDEIEMIETLIKPME